MGRGFQYPRIDPPYDAELKGILSFQTLAQAETTLAGLEKLRQRFQMEGDKKGVECCRRVALAGRRRAESIARNRRVGPSNRRRKQEIATWFRIWLETPDLFPEWLSLRKETEEFRLLLESERNEGG